MGLLALSSGHPARCRSGSVAGFIQMVAVLSSWAAARLLDPSMEQLRELVARGEIATWGPVDAMQVTEQSLIATG